jgi:hypothetical protein
VLNLRQLTKELVEKGWHRGGPETGADDAVIKAIDQRDRDIADRKKSLVDWLNRYKALMGVSTETRASIAGQIIAFADEREEKSLHRDKNKIVSEFSKLKHRIDTVAPRNKTGKGRAVTSLTSKALWCCYPNDIPIFDRNAVSALGIISRVCHLAPIRDQSEYSSFVDVWLWIYNEVESVIGPEDLSDCPYKVRALDRLLWYLGQDGFYDQSDDSSAV